VRDRDPAAGPPPPTTATTNSSGYGNNRRWSAKLLPPLQETAVSHRPRGAPPSEQLSDGDAATNESTRGLHAQLLTGRPRGRASAHGANQYPCTAKQSTPETGTELLQQMHTPHATFLVPVHTGRAESRPLLPRQISLRILNEILQ